LSRVVVVLGIHAQAAVALVGLEQAQDYL